MTKDIFDVLIVYSDRLATSAGTLKDGASLPFAKGSSSESYNVIYGYFLKICQKNMLKVAFTTSSDIIGAGKCQSYWLYEGNSWVKVRKTGYSKLIFDKFSPTNKKIKNNRRLLFSSKKIKHFDGSLKKLVDEMIATMYEHNGIGLAAVQIGELRKVAISRAGNSNDVLVLINPEIIEQQGIISVQEGCLSIPGKWGNVRRPESISIKAQDINGKVFKIKNATDLLAQVLSHEIDHLDGKLFVNRLVQERSDVS